MSVSSTVLDSRVQYETLLSLYSNRENAIALLRQYRPYFELIPSVRRSTDSLLCVPLPVVKLAGADPASHVQLPCDIAMLTCDPEWKIKTGEEIFVFIHRPGEDFSGLLGRWRQVEVMLAREYYWLLPWKYRFVMNEKGERFHPLFVTLSCTPERIRRGLRGAALPFVTIDAIAEGEDSWQEEQETAIQDATE